MKKGHRRLTFEELRAFPGFENYTDEQLESGSPKTKLRIMNTKPKKRLSIDELKSYPGFENYTDEMAEETIASLEALSILFYELHQKSIKEKERLKLFSEKETN